MVKKRNPSSRNEPGYPDWAGRDSKLSPAPSPRGEGWGEGSSRRRFLRQIATTTGGVGFLATVGLPRLGHGQSHEIDFSVLDAHPIHQEVAQPAEAAMPMAAPATPPPAPAQAAAPAPSPATMPQDIAPAQLEELVTEDRALWIEPGYLLLVRWERPADNTAVVASFEGSTDAIRVYLSSNISEMNDLHDLARLHIHEQALLALLEPRIVPAQVEKLHLDHDCNTVCNALGWTGPTGPEIPLPGVPMPIDWE